MSDPDTVAWVDAAGTAHSPLNMPALDASQRTIVLQIRDYFDCVRSVVTRDGNHAPDKL